MGQTRQRILVVEDEHEQATFLAMRLESAGCEVEIAGSGAEALSRPPGEPPDLIILDVRLPDVSGYELCQQLRKQYHASALPILMLTVMAQPIDQLRGFAYGADAYLTKPYDSAELNKTIAALLTRSHRQEISPATAMKRLVDGARDNQFDREVVKAVVDELSLCPQGSLVRLNTGEIGVVEEVTPTAPLRPVVLVTRDAQGQLLPTPRRVNLHEHPWGALQIKAIVNESDTSMKAHTEV